MADGRGVEEKSAHARALRSSPLFEPRGEARRGTGGPETSGRRARGSGARTCARTVAARVGVRARGGGGGRRRRKKILPRDISRTIAAFEKEGRGGCRVCRPGFRLVQTERHRKKTTWIEAGRRAFSSIDRSFHATFRERLTTWVKESVIAPECSPPSRRVRSRREFLIPASVGPTRAEAKYSNERETRGSLVPRLFAPPRPHSPSRALPRRTGAAAHSRATHSSPTLAVRRALPFPLSPPPPSSCPPSTA